MKKFLFLSLILSLCMLTGCKDKADNELSAELTGIHLNKKSTTLSVGSTTTLIVIYEPEEAADYAPEVTWESSTPRVATVDKNGRVSAKQKGTTTITAYCGKFYADCKVEVDNREAEKPQEPAKLEVTPTLIEDKGKGGTYTVTVTSNTAWTASCEQTWATLTPTSGTGDATVSVVVEANTAEQADEQLITFTADKLTKTVKVTRPAKKADDPEKPEVKEFVFSISSTEKVAFSPGNLEYNLATKECRFAEDPLRSIGMGNYEVTKETNRWIDLFCWGAGDKPNSYDCTKAQSNYHDFGENTITGGGDYQWFTLSKDQWDYIMHGRTNASSLMFGVSIADHIGYIILPDNFEKPADVSYLLNVSDCEDNILSYAEWMKLNERGAIFLVMGGYRYEEQIKLKEANYWTSTGEGEDELDAYYLTFTQTKKPYMSTIRKYYAFSIRLVRKVTTE